MGSESAGAEALTIEHSPSPSRVPTGPHAPTRDARA